jgi:hypothetical protein
MTARTVDAWVQGGLLPPPIKLGTAMQSRVRFTSQAVAILDRNLTLLGRARPADEPPPPTEPDETPRPRRRPKPKLRRPVAD